MKGGLRKGAWSAEEDALLKQCIQTYGEGQWHLIPARAGLNRCRKGCRLRWLNYLKPGINRKELQDDEVDLILRLHKLLGNKWSLIAGRLPGRTCNYIKNYWNSHIADKKWKSIKAVKKSRNKQQDSVKVKAIRPIVRRVSKMATTAASTAATWPPPSPPPRLDCNGITTDNEVMDWLDRLLMEDDFCGGDGGCAASQGHCTTAGGGCIDGSVLDQLYIDRDIFHL